MKISFFLFSLLVISLSSVLAAVSASGDGSPAVHIVHVSQSDGQEKPESYHLRILASVLGSEEAAKDAVVYHYKQAASGFSAKLTPQQASDLSKHPNVLLVSPSGRIHLHSGLGSLHRMAVLP